MILRKFLRDESGATAIEYGLIAACISIAIIVAAQSVGTGLNTTFTSVATALGEGGAGDPPADPPAN
jgi:pilus assembly protein Flp/PilA